MRRSYGLGQDKKSPVAEAEDGLRSRSEKDVQRARNKKPLLQSAERLYVHERGRSGRLELAEDERNQNRDAETP